MKNAIISAITALSIGFGASAAVAAGGGGKLLDHDFKFEGAFGTFDQGALQRGFQVYREVCAACHGMKFVSFRTLSDKNGPGLSTEAVKAIAAEYEVADEEGEPGDTRPGKPFDYFPTPLAEGNPPDFSLLAKARANGPHYIYSTLLGYTGEEKESGDSLLYENTAYGGYFSMAQPIDEGYVTYTDGSPETLEQYAADISEFLMWAAEPKMVERKQAGVWSFMFLILFSVLVWFTNKKVWHSVKHPD